MATTMLVTYATKYGSTLVRRIMASKRWHDPGCDEHVT